MDSKIDSRDNFERAIIELAQKISSDISRDIDNSEFDNKKKDSIELFINKTLDLLGLELAYRDATNSSTFGAIYPEESLEDTMKDQLTNVAKLLRPYRFIMLDKFEFSDEIKNAIAKSYYQAMKSFKKNLLQNDVNPETLIQTIINPDKEKGYELDEDFPRNPEIEEALFNAESNLADWKMINMQVDEKTLKQIYMRNQDRINSHGALTIQELKAKGKAGRPGRTH